MSESRKWAVKSYGPAGNLELLTFPTPGMDQLENNDVLVKVLSTTATYTDQLIIRGNYQPCPPLPCTPGYDCIGVVEKVGKDVKSVKVGDRVASMPQSGCMATHIVLPERLALKVRGDIAPEKAVSVVLTGVTSYQMLHRATGNRLKPESKLLIHACGGGTGAMLVVLAKAAGVPASNIFGTCSDKSMDVARGMGIRAFNYKTQDWVKEVRDATDGQGVDVVFDSVILGSYLGDGLGVLKRGGKYIGYGVTDASAPGSLPLASVIWAFFRLSMQQSIWSWIDGKDAEFFNVATRRDQSPKDFADDLSVLMDLLADDKIDPVIGKIWKFEDCKEALQAIESNTHHGKQVILVSN
jgi:NADPH:quinone reductase-like Zn-dependent oxidoreductase